MADGALPLVGALVVREAGLHVFDDLPEGGGLPRRVADGHTDEGDVGVGRLATLHGTLTNPPAATRHVDLERGGLLLEGKEV